MSDDNEFDRSNQAMNLFSNMTKQEVLRVVTPEEVAKLSEKEKENLISYLLYLLEREERGRCV